MPSLSCCFLHGDTRKGSTGTDGPERVMIKERVLLTFNCFQCDSHSNSLVLVAQNDLPCVTVKQIPARRLLLLGIAHSSLFCLCGIKPS